MTPFAHLFAHIYEETAAAAGDVKTETETENDDEGGGKQPFVSLSSPDEQLIIESKVLRIKQDASNLKGMMKGVFN